MLFYCQRLFHQDAECRHSKRCHRLVLLHHLYQQEDHRLVREKDLLIVELDSMHTIDALALHCFGMGLVSTAAAWPSDPVSLSLRGRLKSRLRLGLLALKLHCPQVCGVCNRDGQDRACRPEYG